MKKMVFLLAVMFVCGNIAYAEGMPSKHGVTGSQFGSAVSTMAQGSPGAVSAHVSNMGMGGGMPAKHGVTGSQFGSAVSTMAQGSPGAVSAHVSNMGMGGGKPSK